ncbi:uncharacterized protein LOC134191083 isoform X2 [Corticium candelabrum]|uniref:uncharacterized protein LOC134191083 isoform X2 n=1 Tax=Corticium candelabrum TaxID=121492 RepID=UPI002E25854F|nr:uncharacterized protein LOC134191083 isoform X2 [Corticium candelabrum]
MNVTKIIATTFREDPRNIHSGIPGKSRKCDKDVVELHCATDIPPKMRRLQPFYILSSHEQKEVDQMVATALDKIAGDRQLSDSNFPVLTAHQCSIMFMGDGCLPQGKKSQELQYLLLCEARQSRSCCCKTMDNETADKYFHYDVRLIPMHMPVKQHWCCIVIDITHRTIKYYDPLMEVCSEVFLKIRDWLSDTVTLTKENYVATEWANEVVKNAPWQQDGSSCGVYCLMYMRNEALGIHSNNFCESEINDIRYWLAHRLITQFAANTTGNKSLNLKITPTNIQPSAKYYISWETTEIVTETLESELYDYSLLRLLQTRASLQAWRAEHDDDTSESHKNSVNIMLAR